MPPAAPKKPADDKPYRKRYNLTRESREPRLHAPRGNAAGHQAGNHDAGKTFARDES